MGSDRNYEQIPHRKQYHIPKLKLPDTSGNHHIWVSHGVDHGDLAFIVRAPRQLMDNSYNIRFTTPVFCNITTANYILAGIQIFLGDNTNLVKRTNAWYQLIDELVPGKISELHTNIHKKSTARTKEDLINDILYIITTKKIIPYGICAGSEKQGGQTESTLGPVHGVASYVSTLTIDGQNRDLVNVWRGQDISAGDMMCLGLQRMHVEHFTLNHYYKGTASASFPLSPRIWQLTPRVENVEFIAKMSREKVNSNYVTYWKISQSMQHADSKKPIDFENLDASESHTLNDDMSNLRADIIQVLFSPILIHCENYNSLNFESRIPIFTSCVLTPEVITADQWDTFLTSYTERIERIHAQYGHISSVPGHRVRIAASLRILDANVVPSQSAAIAPSPIQFTSQGTDSPDTVHVMPSTETRPSSPEAEKHQSKKKKIRITPQAELS